MTNISGSAGIQLELIQEITAALQQRGMDYWLFGGWAVDFWLGEITRPHEDIDIIIWREDAPAVREALAEHGYTEAPPDPSESGLHTHFSKRGQPIDVMFIYKQEDGIYWADWRWPEGSFEDRQRRLEGLVCTVTGVRCIVESKESYIQESEDQSDREKYSQDVARLKPLLAEKGAYA